MDGNTNRIDPDRWRPLIMSFGQFYGRADRKLHLSELNSGPSRGGLSPRKSVGVFGAGSTIT
jgi:hypothetical protein